MRAAQIIFVAFCAIAARAEDLETTTLPRLAASEFESGDIAAAERDGHRLLQLSAENAKEWNRDDLAHAGYTVLGRVALERGDLQQAKLQLLESGKLKGSAALETFGPDMKLAQELLAVGERDTVLQYLEMCRGFWKYDRGRIDRLVSLIKQEADPDLLLGAKAPGFRLTDLQGKQWTLAALAGKSVILSFWATWCRPCREELSSLGELTSDHVVLAVNVGEDEETVRRFTAKNPVSVPVLIGGADAMVLSYKVVAFPTLVSIDAKGQIAAYRVGAGEVSQFKGGAQ